MVDLTGSSPANGYTHRVSPCPSPGAMVNKGLSRQSPPSRQHNMRPMMPNSRANMLSPDPVSSVNWYPTLEPVCCTPDWTQC